MENKPVFCTECGAKLTGSARFCSACGAKQEFASTVAAVPAPENSLVAPVKAKVSVVALIFAIAALFMTFMTESTQLYMLGTQASSDAKFSFDALGNFLPNPSLYTGLLAAWVIPIVAIVLALLKKKPAALVGLIFTGLVLLVQLVLAVLYHRYDAYFLGCPMSKLILQLCKMFNGEALFIVLQRVIATKALGTSYGFQSLFSQLGYYLKNILALVACLAATLKRK